MIKEEILELLKHSEKDSVFSFIAAYAAEDMRFYEKIKAVLLPGDDEEAECDMDYYRECADDCFDFESHYSGRRRYDYYDFREAACEAAAALDKMINDATFLTKQGKYANGAAMAMAVAEVIPRKAEEVDDSDGELSDAFDSAIELLCNIVNNGDASASVKKEIYNWSKKEAFEPVYSDYGFDEIKTVYKLCCELLGDADEVLADIDKQINEAKSEYHKCKAVLWKIRFMQSKNMDVENVIRKHLDLNDVRKIKFQQLLNAKEYDKALRIAEQGIEIAKQQYPGCVSDWQKAIFDIYLAKEDTANLLPMAENLFLNAGWGNRREEYYNALKTYTPPANWPDTMERLLKAAEKSSFDNFSAHIMQENKLWPRLFAYCKQGGIHAIEKYEADLKPYFEKEMLEIYRDYVEKKALITDSHAYNEVARILKRMRTFIGGNELVDQLLYKYRVGYKRRKNMIEALKGV